MQKSILGWILVFHVLSETSSSPNKLVQISKTRHLDKISEAQLLELREKKSERAGGVNSQILSNVLKTKRKCGTKEKREHHNRASEKKKKLKKLMEEPHLCSEHEALVCDDPDVILGYASAIESDNIDPIEIDIYIPRIKNEFMHNDEAIPLEDDTRYTMAMVDDYYSQAKVSFNVQTSIWEFSEPLNKKQFSGAILTSCPVDWLADDYCDDDCNFGILDFDAKDCSRDPLFGSMRIPPRNRCDRGTMIGNGICEGGCNNVDNHWDGGDCCPESNSHWDENYPEGLGIECSETLDWRISEHYDCTGCLDPSSPNKQWYGTGDTENYFLYSEWKELFEDCTLVDGTPCYEGAIPIYVNKFAEEDLTLGTGHFPWDAEANTVMGGVVMNLEFTWRHNSSDFGTSLTHEIGHNFGNYHTHRGVDEVADIYGVCQEDCVEWNYINGDGSMVTGDLCADTRPTPLNYECEDPTTDLGECKNHLRWQDTPYTNFMGYGDPFCIDTFTTQQLARTRCYLDLVYDDVWDASLHPPRQVVTPPIHEIIENNRIHVTWQPSVASQERARNFIYEIKRDPQWETQTSVVVNETNFFDDIEVDESIVYRYSVLSIFQRRDDNDEGERIVSNFWSPWSVSIEELETASPNSEEQIQEENEQPPPQDNSVSRLCNIRSASCFDGHCLVKVDTSPGDQKCFLTSTNTETSDFEAIEIEGSSEYKMIDSAKEGVKYCFGCICDNSKVPSKNDNDNFSTDGECIIYVENASQRNLTEADDETQLQQIIWWKWLILGIVLFVVLVIIIFICRLYGSRGKRGQYTLTKAEHPHNTEATETQRKLPQKRKKNTYASVGVSELHIHHDVHHHDNEMSFESDIELEGESVGRKDSGVSEGSNQALTSVDGLGVVQSTPSSV